MKTFFGNRAALLAATLFLGAPIVAPQIAPVVWAQNDEEDELDPGHSVSRGDVLGEWKSSDFNRYIFRSNGTYTFFTGNTSSGNVSHSGTWSLRDSGSTLRLRATRRVVLERRRRKTLKANKTFTLTIGTFDINQGIIIDGEEFARPYR